MCEGLRFLFLPLLLLLMLLLVLLVLQALVLLLLQPLLVHEKPAKLLVFLHLENRRLPMQLRWTWAVLLLSLITRHSLAALCFDWAQLWYGHDSCHVILGGSCMAAITSNPGCCSLKSFP
jgi:energy-coupling factor transporter transmembrane protein EcfT